MKGNISEVDYDLAFDLHFTTNDENHVEDVEVVLTNSVEQVLPSCLQKVIKNALESDHDTIAFFENYARGISNAKG